MDLVKMEKAEQLNQNKSGFQFLIYLTKRT